MKLILMVSVLFAAMAASAQNMLVPGSNVVSSKWLVNQRYQMVWYTVKDSARFEIGKTSTQITVGKDSVIVVTSISMQQNQLAWVDSTIANAKDLSPIYHSSCNAQRDMVLNFGKIVTGFYKDKKNNHNTAIHDIATEAYFDSNLYTTLIGWLPLKEGYRQTIPIYDYSPGGKTGVIKATIHSVKKSDYQTVSAGLRTVWLVTVSDEIGGTESDFSTYYIDAKDRRLWKQKIKAGGRIMEMVLIENPPY